MGKKIYYFASGFAQMFDLPGNIWHPKLRARLISSSQDIESIRVDWANVGKDIKKAMNEQEKATQK